MNQTLQTGQYRLILNGHEISAYGALHHSGRGPGLMLIGDGTEIDDALRQRADLFGEEGYAVLALAGAQDHADIVAARKLLADLPQTSGPCVAVGHGIGGVLALETAKDAGFAAVVAFDPPAGNDLQSLTEAVPCPFVIQFGTAGDEQTVDMANRLKVSLRRADGSRIFQWPEAEAGFAMPGRASYDRRADDLAHTRTLELIRRVAGPYFDFVELFAQHVHHEFTTMDVDATMATMIDQPYVNHVPTLAGGVGHDMLKRFYKYHFVTQNAGGRERVRISYTMGPDRLVLESYTKFRHDQVIDRYFPGIAPTGKTVEIATVIIVKFRGDKVCHEHLYWDQGSALKQIGLIKDNSLPLAGPEAARKVLDETLPSNIFMQEAWATSDGKPL